MSFSEGFKINVNKLSADEALMILVELTHPSLNTPVRIVNDNQDFEFQTNLYMAIPFEVKRQDDVQGELPQAILVVPNAGRSLTKWIDTTNGGIGALLRVILARRSDPNTIENELFFTIDNINLTMQTVTFNLVVQNNLVKRAMRFIYDIKRAPGLF